MTVGSVSLLKALNLDRSLGGKQLPREFGMSVSQVVFQSYPFCEPPYSDVSMQNEILQVVAGCGEVV